MYELRVAFQQCFPIPLRMAKPDTPWYVSLFGIYWFFSLTLAVVLPLLVVLASTVAAYLRQSSLPTVVPNNPYFFLNPLAKPRPPLGVSTAVLVRSSFRNLFKRLAKKTRGAYLELPLPTAQYTLADAACAARPRCYSLQSGSTSVRVSSH
ncbi:hypothetical protein F5141DRAFT_1138538, partial [Pisolithus sp. B1]